MQIIDIDSEGIECVDEGNGSGKIEELVSHGMQVGVDLKHAVIQMRLQRAFGAPGLFLSVVKDVSLFQNNIKGSSDVFIGRFKKSAACDRALDGKFGLKEG